MKCSAYILKSLKDGKYYYGSTRDVLKRLKRHQEGKVTSTKFRRPLILHYTEDYDNYPEAFKREAFFKTIDGYNWLKQNDII